MPVKRERGRQTVEKLLDSALTVYSQKGPRDYTLSAVLEHSGVSVGSLYHHFGGFDGLNAALYLRGSRDLNAELTEAILPQTTAKGGIQAFVLTIIDWCERNRDMAHFMLVIPHMALADRTAETWTEVEEMFAELVAWLVPHFESGALRPMPVRMFEALVNGPVNEFLRAWLLGLPEVGIDDARAVLPERIWESVKGD
ncbi:TetR/AcrR family transcriptional regulator [Salininema proteolyticum]|uniref:TetR/AcrR family transcriptional regulator n=1 Tax=Salininema proteolyticum TaxID=1607685 RepID=A0ABV8U5E2_9ACTN